MSFGKNAIHVQGWLKTVYFHITHPNGAFGRRGKYYTYFLCIAELYEIPMQTYQAYTISRIAVSPYPAFISGITIMLNCIGIVYIEYHHNDSNNVLTASRLLCLDGAASIIVSMVVPMYTILGPFSKVIADSTAFGDDAVGMGFMTGGEIATVSSFVDMVARLFPVVCCFAQLRFLESNWHEITIENARQKNQIKVKAASPAPAMNGDIDLTKSFLSSWKLRVYLFVILIWGLTVGGISIEAFSRESCLSELHQRHCSINSWAWLRSEKDCTCLALHYDCNFPDHQYDLENSSSNVVVQFSREVRKFEIKHCPIDTLPESLGELMHVRNIIMVNLNIKKITFDASRLREIMTLGLYRMPLEELPEVTPSSLVMLICTGTRISKLPELPYEKLHMVMAGMNPNITEFPPFFYKLRKLKEIHLRNNSISEISSDIQNMPQLEKITLSGNRISKLPQEMKSLVELRVLYLDGNLIEEVPWTKQELVEWNTNPEGMDAGNFLFKDISLAHNPVCHDGKELADTVACEPTWSIGCTKEFGAMTTCDLLCDSPTCDFPYCE